jgi:hypothetical protein
MRPPSVRFLWACIIAAGCGQDGPGPADLPGEPADLPVAEDAQDATGEPEATGPACRYAVAVGGPVALFSLDGTRPILPFPSDRFTRPEAGSPTGLRVDPVSPGTVLVDGALDFIAPVADVRGFLGEIDGFSAFGPILFGFSAPVDPKAAVSDPVKTGPDGPVFLLELDPKSGACTGGGRIPVFVSVEEVYEPDVKGLVVARPFLPLKPATPYLAVITRGLADRDGHPFEASPHFRAAAGLASPPADVPADRFSRVSETLSALASCLAALEPPLCPADVAVATRFTTRDGPATVRGIREFLLSPEAPPLNVALERDDKGAVVVYEPANLPSVPEGQDYSASSVAVRGSFDVPDFRSEDRDVHYAGTGVPEVHGFLKVPFVLLLPADPAHAPFRVAVMAHGHSGNKERVAHLAWRFGEAGLALAGIDHLGHGELAGTGTFLTTDVHMARGNFLQSDANLVAFLLAIRSLKDVDVFPPGKPDGIPDLDLDAGLGFVGESLGSLVGSPASALDPEVRAVVLNVGGGGLLDCAPDTVDPLLGGSDPLVYWGLKSTLQAVVDSFDPIAFARGIAQPAPAPRAILMQAVIGDSAFDGPPTANLARALGLEYVCPCPKEVPFLDTVPAPVSVSGLVYYANAAHGFLLANSSNPAASDSVRRQAALFLSTALGTGKGEIRDFPYAAP